MPKRPRTSAASPRSARRQAPAPARPPRPARMPKRTRPKPAGPALRIGHGYDLHRLAPVAPAGHGRPMVIGGVKIPDFPLGPVGHSDGDVLYHCVTDAILGALAQPDIGQLFPDTDPRHDGQDSAEFLVHAVGRAHELGYRVSNLDVTVIAERPKLGPIKGLIRENLARLLGVPAGCVNVKGKTHEQVDAVGEGRAIECHAVVLMTR